MSLSVDRYKCRACFAFIASRHVRKGKVCRSNLCKESVCMYRLRWSEKIKTEVKCYLPMYASVEDLQGDCGSLRVASGLFQRPCDRFPVHQSEWSLGKQSTVNSLVVTNIGQQICIEQSRELYLTYIFDPTRTRPNLGRRWTLGCLKSIDPNFTNHFPSQSQTCQRLKNQNA